MVFERVLQTQEDRYDAYVKCLSALNIDYTTDRIAFRQMVKAKSVIDLFPDHHMATRIYELAKQRAGEEDGPLIHQTGLYEMNRPNGSLHDSAELLALASQLRPFDNTIKHSQAELKLRFAENARTTLERDKYIDEAVRLSRAFISSTSGDAYAHVTLVKAGLARITAILDGGEADSSELGAAVKEVERSLVDGLQQYPADSYLLAAEAQLAEQLSDSTRAIDALSQAFKANPRSSFIAIRLARCHERNSNPELAMKVLEEALGANQTERRLHYSHAKLLVHKEGVQGDTILYHLQRSFSPGDTNYDARLLYGRQLFIGSELDNSKTVFLELRDAPIQTQVKFKLLYPLDQVFRGEIERVEATYAFIVRDGPGDWIYLHRNNVGGLPWHEVLPQRRVRFRIAVQL